jgi:zinc/manganese transport system substrate-binding protein
MLEKPARLDRAEGDVHAAGNPHIQTDPRNIARVATALSARLAEIDPANAEFYRTRLAAFEKRWTAATARWEKEAAPLRGVPVLVQHRAFPYLFAWLGIREVGALEPKPGVEPTTSHLAQLLSTLKAQPVKMVIRAAYQDDRASQWMAERAGIRAVSLPFTVGGSEQATDLFGLFDDTVKRLLEGLR